MDPPLTCWYCDACGARIETPQKGYVLWNNEQGMSKDFTIIHTECKVTGEHNSSLALPHFLGSRGLVELTAMLTVGPLKRALGEKQQREVANPDRFVDFFRRLQLEHYEEARRYFADPRFREDFSHADEVVPYLPETLKEIIERYSR